MAPIIEDRILGGPGQALQNLIEGNPSGAYAAIMDPAEMTPHERDIFLKKHGLDKGIYAPVFRLLTNPAVILSAALSMKFPVPTAQNMFRMSEKVSGFTSRFPILRGLSSMQAIFRGTEVPDVYSKIVTDVHDFRSKYAGKLGTSLEKFKQSTGALPSRRDQKLMALWLDGMHRSTGGWFDEPLAPALEAYMTPALKKLATDTRGILDEVYDEMFGTPLSRKKIASAIVRAKRAGFQDKLMDALQEWAENPTKIDHYYPRRTISTEADFRSMVQAMTQTGKEAQFVRSAEERTRRLVGPNAFKREGSMLPSLDELEEVQDVLDPAAFERLKGLAKTRVLKAAKGSIGPEAMARLEQLDVKQLRDYREYSKVLDQEDAMKFTQAIAHGPYTEYDLRASHALNGYIHTMASTYGWTVKDGGDKMLNITNQLRALSNDPKFGARAKQRLAMLENTYIPVALGRGTFQTALKAQMWEQSMLRMADTLETPKVRDLLGAPLHKRMTEALRNSRGAFSLMNIERVGASYFYLSTLGLNPASALKNLLQLVLTTGPTVGFRTAAKGAHEALKKSSAYFSARYGKGLSHDDALRAAYPNFAKAGLVATPLTDEALQLTLQNAYEAGAKIPGALVTTKEKVARSMMALFSASEHAVRLSTFEAGMFHAKRSGMGLDDSIKFAKKLTETTQFLTGPQNTPYALIDKGPLTRQLLQFPIRMAEFATSTAMTLGSGEKSVLGLNPGTLSRAILGSVIAYEAGNAAGVDISDSLLGSAIPGFQEPGKVLAPIPLVPPAYQILGAAAFGVKSGDWEEFQRAVPLMVPGGVAAARVVGLLPGGERVAELVGRQYADYDAPSPTGRIGVYTSEGRLRGFFTPWELFAMGVGVRTGDNVAEQALLETVVANRDTIRASRQQYVEALMQNDPATAENVSRNFKKRFGFELPVSKRDIDAAQLRRSIPRLEQVLKTLPPGELRNQFAQVIAAAMADGGSGLLGGSPGQVSAQSSRQSFGSPTPLQPSQTQMSLSRGVNPGSLSTRKPDADQFGGF